MAAVCIGTAMVLIDFWFGHGTYRLVGFSPGLSRSEQLALPKVRYFLYGELYDLTLHLAMLAVALAGALIFMAVARRFLQPTGSRGARRLRNCPDRRLLWIQPASRSHPRWS